MDVLLLMGGGIDSTLCLALAKQQNRHVKGLHVDYGQPAAEKEWESVQKFAAIYGAPALQFGLQGAKRQEPGLYLGRNAFLIQLALLQLAGPQAAEIWLGIHSGTPFYDCSHRFWSLMTELVLEESDGRVRLICPLLDLSKAEIVEQARKYEIPLELTYSCQLGGSNRCGSCLSCGDRRVTGC
jgi:7-cyano-7-deazaguanine synthase